MFFIKIYYNGYGKEYYLMKENWKIEGRTHQYYVKNNFVVLCDLGRYDYNEDAWVYSPDSYFASVINSNDADAVSEDEARKIVEKNGGTNFDKQDEIIVK